MAYDYDVLTIGLGPAGMAVSAMSAEMGLKVCAIEGHKIGGECMNVGCIPSKALLRMAKTRNVFRLMNRMELAPVEEPKVLNPFQRIQADLKYINDNKTVGMFKKVDLILQQGKASFVDPHTVQVGDRVVTAKRIFIATGTRPALPGIPGLDEVEILTNENLFHLDRVPESLVIIGGGAIACEMAQAFARLGSRCTLVIRGPRLLRHVDEEAVQLLEAQFQNEGIEILRNSPIEKVLARDGSVEVLTEGGDTVVAERILVAAGRKMDFSSLGLERAGVKYSDRGITVNERLQTSRKHIYAIGDCNGYAQFSHAAMHQGMVALMNCMIPGPFKLKYRDFVVPWTIFTEPQISHVGASESELQERGVKYETIKVNYADYGAAIAEGVDLGFVKVFASPTGRIFGATVVGEGSGDMVNEWGLAIQRKIPMYDVLFLQHSFPSMGFLNKRIAETWTMKRMKSSVVRFVSKTLYRLGG